MGPPADPLETRHASAASEAEAFRPSASPPPLGLPSGSVRALLTLLIVAVIVAEVARGRDVEVLWTETLMIALAHYFTSRRFIDLSGEAIRRLQQEGRLEQEPNPLYLPRNSIRGLIILAFAGLAAYLYRDDRLLLPEALSILGMVGAYFVGVMFRGIWSWWAQGRPTRWGQRWEDAKAVLVLLVLGMTAAAYLLDRSDLVPHQLRNVTLPLVLFYFGSR